MKTQKQKAQDENSIKNNSMTIGGKSPKTKKGDDAGPKEFEEDRSMKLRMKPQPLKAVSKNKK